MADLQFGGRIMVALSLCVLKNPMRAAIPNIIIKAVDNIRV
jgi:hypothetical protein